MSLYNECLSEYTCMYEKINVYMYECEYICVCE